VDDSIRQRSGRTVLLAALVAATLTAPSISHAAGLTAECLISKVPPATLDRLAVAYAQHGRAGVIALPTNLDVDAIFACTGPPASLDPATARELGRRAGALMGIASMEYASRAYLADHGASGAALDGAWRQLGPTKREFIRNAYRQMEAKDPKFDGDAFGEVIVDGAQLAGWTSAQGPEIVLKYGDYFIARAVREDMESR